VSPSWLVRATRTLDAAGVPSPQVDAVLLAQECSGVPRARLGDLDDPGPRFWALVERRARREPVQHLVGKAWFRHLEVAVGPGVFVPRPETELVAGAAVDEAERLAAGGRPPVVVDLGAGSGVIGLSVRHEVPVAVVHAVEVDPDAFGWLRRNAEGSGVLVHLADLADCLPELEGEVDVVVSNPPYIPAAAVPREVEVREHDPARALYGTGEDGLGEVRAVIGRAARLLRPNGLLAVEHADVQQDAVVALVGGSGEWADVQGHRDLAGRPRYVTARRAAAA
jgi:release factor glutamine methyltransferase